MIGRDQSKREGLLIGNHDFFKKIAIAMYVRDFDSKTVIGTTMRLKS